MSRENPQIFIYVAGNPESQAHANGSLRNPLDLDRVLKLFPTEEHVNIRAIASDHGLYAWGAVPGKRNNPLWNALKPGDWALCVYSGAYHFVSQILAKHDNQKFGREVWGTDDAGNTWQLMYFLTKPQPIDIRVEDVSDYLWHRYMGFSRIGDGNVQRIRNDHGSVDKFIEKVFLKGETPSIQARNAYFLIRSNPESEWKDQAGKVYNFGSTVPNSSHLKTGGQVVVDTRAPDGIRLVGYGQLAPAKETGTYQRDEREGVNYESEFIEWYAFNAPRPISPKTFTKIRALAGYNVQHAIRPITKEDLRRVSC